MDNQKEPIVPDMTPSRDDIEMRQRQLKSRRPVTPPAPPTSSAAGGVLAPVALVIGLIAAGVAGWLFWQASQLQEELGAARATLAEQAASIKTLNERLSTTGENASLSLEAQKVLLKEHDSEIRKLWDVSNKRNKRNIANNTSGVAANTRDLKALGGQVAGVGNKLTEQQQVITQQQSELGGLADRLIAAESTLVSLPETELLLSQNTEALELQQARIQQLQTELETRDASIERLTRRLQMLEKRVTTLHTPAATQ